MLVLPACCCCVSSSGKTRSQKASRSLAQVPRWWAWKSYQLVRDICCWPGFCTWLTRSPDQQPYYSYASMLPCLLRRRIQQEASSPQSPSLRHQDETTQGDPRGQLCECQFVLFVFCPVADFILFDCVVNFVGWYSRSTSTSAWCADEATRRTGCCCVTAVMTATTPSAWSHLCRTCPRGTGAALSVLLRYTLWHCEIYPEAWGETWQAKTLSWMQQIT